LEDACNIGTVFAILDLIHLNSAFFWQNLNVGEIFGQNLNVGTDGSTRHFLTLLTKLYFLAIECTNKSLLCDKKTHSMYIK